MSYTLNDIELTDYGFVPGRAPDSNLAIEGIWDMPKRMGKTYHEWDDEHGVEPYVDAEEIRFEGRDIKLHGLITGVDETDTLEQCYDLADFIDGFNDLVELSCDWGTWEVYFKDAIEVNYLRPGVAEVVLIMREPVVDLSGGDDPASYELDTTLEPQQMRRVDGIDGTAFADMGLTPLKLNNYLYRPAMKEMEVTQYSAERYDVKKTTSRKIAIKWLLQADDYDGFKSHLKDLYKLLSNPGLRYLTKEGDAVVSFFVDQGVKVSQIRAYDEYVSALLELEVMYSRLDQVVPERAFIDLDGITFHDLDGEILVDAQIANDLE